MVSASNGGGGGYGDYIQDQLKKAARETKSLQGRGANSAINPGMPVGLDADAMAAAEFAPQYQLLEQMKQQASGKYGKAGSEIGGMYDSLAKALRGQEGGIKANYNEAGSKIGSAFNDAINQTNQSFGQSRNDLADIAKRLGVEAAAPSAMQDGADQQGRLAGLLAAGKQNLQGVNTLLGNNDVAYNRNTADTTQIAGANARKDIKSKLLDLLAGYDNKGLELKGAEQEAENKYGMSIQQMMQEAQLAREKMSQDAQQKAGSDELAQARLMLDQSRFGLDNDKFLASQGKAASNKDASPYEALAATAAKLYPNMQAATNASKAIEDTFSRGYNGDTSWNNANDFLQDVMKRNPQAQGNNGDARQLQQLALLFYTKLAGGAGKSFNGLMSQ